jgi:uncharacterized protein (DUF2126 family)
MGRDGFFSNDRPVRINPAPATAFFGTSTHERTRKITKTPKTPKKQYKTVTCRGRGRWFQPESQRNTAERGVRRNGSDQSKSYHPVMVLESAVAAARRNRLQAGSPIRWARIP